VKKHITNRFLWAGDHRSPLQYVLKRYDKLKFAVPWQAKAAQRKAVPLLLF